MGAAAMGAAMAIITDLLVHTRAEREAYKP